MGVFQRLFLCSSLLDEAYGKMCWHDLSTYLLSPFLSSFPGFLEIVETVRKFPYHFLHSTLQSSGLMWGVEKNRSQNCCVQNIKIEDLLMCESSTEYIYIYTYIYKI